MSNPAAATANGAPAAKPVEKTPSYAWPCLIVSLLAAVGIVYAWMWLPASPSRCSRTGWPEQLRIRAGRTRPTSASCPMSWASCPSQRSSWRSRHRLLVRKFGPRSPPSSASVGARSVSGALTIVRSGNFTCSSRAASSWPRPSTTDRRRPHVRVHLVPQHDPRPRHGHLVDAGHRSASLRSNVFVNDGIYHAGRANLVTLSWVWIAVAAVVSESCSPSCSASPARRRRSEVSARDEAAPAVLPFFKSRQLWCLIITCSRSSTT